MGTGFQYGGTGSPKTSASLLYAQMDGNQVPYFGNRFPSSNIQIFVYVEDGNSGSIIWEPVPHEPVPKILIFTRRFFSHPFTITHYNLPWIMTFCKGALEVIKLRICDLNSSPLLFKNSKKSYIPRNLHNTPSAYISNFIETSCIYFLWKLQRKISYYSKTLILH